MVSAPMGVSASPESLPKTPTLVKRQRIADLLLSGQNLSDDIIAIQVGCSRRTVFTMRHALHDYGVKVAMTDNRVKNGAKARYANVWKLIDQLKKDFPGWGGRQLHFHLETVLKMSAEELPSIGRIENYLFEKGFVGPKTTAKTDKRPYFMEDYYKPMVRCGMDCQTVAPYGDGREVTVVSVIDFYTRAVYSEAFPWNATDSHYRGIGSASFAGVLMRFCVAFGTPEVLVLDNGAGQVTQSGWLSEVARVALSLGIRVEWEPYGRPWRNGAVENWHKHSQRWWEGIRHEFKLLSQVQRVWRERAWLYTTCWRQRKFGNKPASSLLERCNPWPFDGEDAGPLDVPSCPKTEHEWTGIVSFQREVETNGYVKLHGNDHLFVSEMLVGGYVRVDVHIQSRGMWGTGSVYDGKGRLVGNFSHSFECKRPAHGSLMWDYNAVGYADTQDVRQRFFDQQAYNKHLESAHKNQRARSDYEQTGSVPVMRSRKKGKF